MSYGLLSMALVVFAVSVFLSFSRIRQSHEAALETSGVSLWLAFQADYEAQRLLHALDLYVIGDARVSGSDLLDRFNIFWSRLPLLIQGKDSRAITRVSAAESVVPDVVAALEQVEPSLQALAAGNLEHYPAVRQQIAQIQEPLRRLSLQIDQMLGQDQTRLQRQMEDLYPEHVLFLLGILCSSTVFITLLVLESFKTRRLLAATADAQARVAHLAHHDALTDLPNRILFQDRLEQALALARRQKGPIAIHCLDLDRFKDVNDRHGHAVGDALLVAATHRMLACLRQSDTLARLGGDEFAVIQVDLSEARGATRLAERLIRAFDEPLPVDQRELPTSVSVGVALFPDDDHGSAPLLRKADMALYKAKADGRGTARFYSSDMDRQREARHQVERDLRRALQSGGLELHYQPKFALRGRRIVGMEALLRWDRPGYGLLEADEFLPVAEECGLITAVSDWVLATACKQNGAWQKAGLPALRVAVNLSAAGFASPELVERIGRALRESGLRADHLELEITESVLLHDTKRTLAVLLDLRRLGIRLSLDHFGAGYSSLNYLMSFNFDTLKLDRSFVRDLGAGGTGEAVCRALLALARSLDMSVVAEGVETAHQLERLEAMACDLVQGPYLGAPEPPEAFERRLTALIAA